MMKISETTKLQVIHFLVQKVHLCLEIWQIEKVLQLVELEQLPNSPPYVAGLMNLEGNSIPIIDLALRLGLKRETPYALSTPILLCNNDNKFIGIIVDNILGLTTVEKNALQMKNNFNDPASPFKAVVELDSKLALLLNIQQILSINLTNDNPSSNFDIKSVNLAGFKYE